MKAEQVEQLGKLLTALEQASGQKSVLHQKYMSFAMPDDVWEQFSKLRDETIPKLRQEIRELFQEVSLIVCEYEIVDDLGKSSYLTRKFLDEDHQNEFENGLALMGMIARRV